LQNNLFKVIKNTSTNLIKL